MVKIFEKQQQVNDVSNYQSRIVEKESFEEYLQSVNDSLPHNAEIYKKHVNFRKNVITFVFELNILGKWNEFIHYAEVIE